LSGRRAQVAHDVNHGLAPRLQTQLVPVRVLKDVKQRPPRVVGTLMLSSESAAIVLVVDQNVEHRLALSHEALVRLVQVNHNVEHRATLLVTLSYLVLQHFYMRAELAVSG